MNRHLHLGRRERHAFWIDPQEDLIGILMIQINPYAHFSIRPLLSVAVSQAITDSLADQKPRVMGYDTPR